MNGFSGLPDLDCRVRGICSSKSKAETLSTELSGIGIFEIFVIWTNVKLLSSNWSEISLTSVAIRRLHLNGLLGLFPDPRSKWVDSLGDKSRAWSTCQFIQLGFHDLLVTQSMQFTEETLPIKVGNRASFARSIPQFIKLRHRHGQGDIKIDFLDTRFTSMEPFKINRSRIEPEKWHFFTCSVNRIDWNWFCPGNLINEFATLIVSKSPQSNVREIPNHFLTDGWYTSWIAWICTIQKNSYVVAIKNSTKFL